MFVSAALEDKASDTHSEKQLEAVQVQCVPDDRDSGKRF